jgi:hypothetical protein
VTSFRIKIAGTARVVDSDNLDIKPGDRLRWLVVLQDRRKKLSKGVRYEIEVIDPRGGPVTYREPWED